jgi:hypothetical protein
VPEIIATGTEVAAPIIVPRAGAIIEKTLGGTSEATESTISTSAPVVPPGIKTQETTTTESTQETAQIQQKPQQQDEQQQQQGRYVFDDPQYTVIGKREDLLSGKYEDGIYDHWYKSGRVPDVDLGEPPVTWAENQAWLDERIQRGDKFILGTDPTTLPPPDAHGFIEGVPNGYFTAREVQYLQKQGQTIRYGDSDLPPLPPPKSGGN